MCHWGGVMVPQSTLPTQIQLRTDLPARKQTSKRTAESRQGPPLLARTAVVRPARRNLGASGLCRSIQPGQAP